MDHPLRSVLIEEVHARPFAVLAPPEQASLFALKLSVEGKQHCLCPFVVALTWSVHMPCGATTFSSADQREPIPPLIQTSRKCQCGTFGFSRWVKRRDASPAFDPRSKGLHKKGPEAEPRILVELQPTKP